MTTSNYNRSRFVPGGDGAVMRNVENSAIKILQESRMSSNNSRAAKTWPGNRHDTLSGRDVPIEDIDGVSAAHRRPALVPLPDSSARRIPSVGPESAKEADRPPLSFWSVVFENLMESFVLYGSSLHPNAFPVELPRMDHNIPQPADEMPPPRGPRAVVPYSASPGEVAAAHLKKMSGDLRIVSVESGFVKSDGGAPVGVIRRRARELWNLTAGLWTDWRHEREIKRAVRALAEFDDRTLRDMGIGDRAQIELTVRHGRDF
jgi:uncharacterized protein YjiS (DUF1127 family)